MMPSLNVDKIKVGGLPVAVLDRTQTAKLMVDLALGRRGSSEPPPCFTSVNGQILSLCATNNSARELYEKAHLISPDGMSIVWGARLFARTRLPERVATTDLFHDVAATARNRNASFFLFGAAEKSNRDAVDAAGKLYPGLKIVGRRNGYFEASDEARIADEINASAPDILWVALGAPLQMEFVERQKLRLTRVGLIKTCGGLFDFLSGSRSRAPMWMQSAGLEWLYRTSLEPHRLLTRYLVTNPHAIWLMATRSGRQSSLI